MMIALYKAWTGGEWFEASLNSIKDAVDGIVIVFATWPGVESLNDCWEPMQRFAKANPGLQIVHKVIGSVGNQEEQWSRGLAMIEEKFGAESNVMIIDTDEVWRPGDAQKLQNIMEYRHRAEKFTANIWSYVRSPLYQVYPQEASQVIVGLRGAGPLSFTGRFTGPQMPIPTGLSFDHFTYVRDPEEAVYFKFLATSSQESTPSRGDWMRTVWRHLPQGCNLHMTPGHESAWRQIKPITAADLHYLKDVPVFRDTVSFRNEIWREIVKATPPDRSMMPVPNNADAEKYLPDLDRLCTWSTGETTAEMLALHLKTTYLEACWLSYWASQVPKDGLVLEIGSGHGGSTACLASAWNESTGTIFSITCVDPFEIYDEQTHAGTVRGVMEGDEEVFWRMAEVFDYRGRVILLKQCSTKVHGNLSDNYYALALVDGNHSEEYAWNDIQLCWSKLSPGGLLVVHDYSTRFPGVIAAVDRSGIKGEVQDQTSLFFARKP